MASARRTDSVRLVATRGRSGASRPKSWVAGGRLALAVVALQTADCSLRDVATPPHQFTPVAFPSAAHAVPTPVTARPGGKMNMAFEATA